MKKNGRTSLPLEPRKKAVAKKLAEIPEGMSEALLLTALTAFKKGDFSIRLPLGWDGKAGKIADFLERSQTTASAYIRLNSTTLI